jgi:hypothetical protein
MVGSSPSADLLERREYNRFSVSAALQIHDETSTGERTASTTLILASERVTAREVLRRRIEQEVEAFNRAQPEYFQGLVQPTDAERVLNGYRLRKPRVLDWREQASSAEKAFANNGFLMLVGDRQVDDLDEEFVVTPGLSVSFVRLVPLVGG